MTRSFSSILIFGDSHFAGCELLPYEQIFHGWQSSGDSDPELATKALSFGSVLGRHYGVPVINLAMSGGSNDRGLRLLPQALLDHPDSLCIFGWTTSDRTEFYYPQGHAVLGRDRDLYAQVGMQWYDWPLLPRLEPWGITSPINDVYVERLLFPQPDHHRLVNQMFYVDQVCAGFAADHRHCLIWPNLITADHSPVLDRIDPGRIIDFGLETNRGWGSYIDWCRHRGHQQLELLHFDRAAHEDFAELIIRDLG